MDSERWRRIEEAFESARRLDGAAREEYLTQLAADDSELAAEVASLLASDSDRLALVVGRAAAAVSESATDAESPDLRFGPYRTLRLLGAGGMGAVYLGERTTEDFEQRVALKVVRTALATDEARARFVAERRILAGLQHDRIARFIDGGLADDGLTPWFAMEYVEGRPLTEALEAAPLARRLEVFAEICDAVHYAHRNLVVHRDLKPSNILVDAAGRPKLLDFGIAKVLASPEADGEASTELTRAGSRPFTPAYAAPEQISGESVTTATDVYALGLLLYELLTGVHPFESQRRSGSLQHAILHSTPRPPSRAAASAPGAWQRARPLARDLDAICLMALRRGAERRHGWAADGGGDVRRHLDHRPVTATPDSIGYRLGKLVRRHRSATLVAALATLLVVALSVAYGLRLQRERDLAVAERRKADQVAGFLTELFSASDPSRSLGEETSARQLLDRGVERIERELVEQPAVRSDLLHVMGDVHKRLGLYERALELLGRAVEIDAGLGASRDLERARSLLRAGEVELYRERFDDAEPLLRRALEIQRRELAEPSSELAETLDLLGRMERERRRLEAAEAFHQEALAVRRRLHDEASLPVSESLQSLAMLRQVSGRSEEAIELLRQALAIRAEVLGPRHPESLELRQNLATALQQTGQLERALVVMREVLDGIRETYGEEHQNAAFALSGIGYSLQQLGRIEEAIENDRAAVEILRRRGGGPAAVGATVQLARHLLQAGELEEAERAARQALVWLEDTPEDPDRRRSNVLIELGGVLTQQRRYDEARAALRDALEIDVVTYGDEHPYVAQDRYKLGELARTAGRYDEALECFDRALDFQRGLRPGANALGLSLVGRGETLLAMGRAAEAEATLREALEVFAVETPAEHPDFAAARLGLGAALAAQGELEEAMAWIVEARDQLAAALGPDHPRSRLAEQRVAELSESP